MLRASRLALVGLAACAAGTIGVCAWRPRAEALAPAAALPVAPAAPAPDGERSTVIVGLDGSALELERAALELARAVDGRLVGTCPELGCALVEGPGAGPALRARLAALPGVAYAEVNRTAAPAGGRGRCTCQGEPHTSLAPPDVHDLGAVADGLGLRQAWLTSPARGQGVLVAIVDTGVEPATPGLAGACEAGLDLVEEGGAARDLHGHGTAMAGVIAGRGDAAGTAPAAADAAGRVPGAAEAAGRVPGAAEAAGRAPAAADAAGTVAGPAAGTAVRGFQGVAPGARVLPVRVADERGGAPVERVARGIVRAADRGARVIYVGLAVRGASPTLARAVAYAREAGALVVCPTGNDALDVVRSPAREPLALAVGGLSGAGLAHAANLDGRVPLAAPAEHVPAPFPDHVRFVDGTSVAAALVTGVAALVLGADPTLDPDGLRRVLVAGARPLPELSQGVLAERLVVRALQAEGAVARAHPDHAEVALAPLTVVPWPPAAGLPAQVRVRVENRGRRPLGPVTLEASAGRVSGRTSDAAGAQALPAGPALAELAPGEVREVLVPWTASAAGEPVRLRVVARALPRGPASGPGSPHGAAAPCVALGGLEVVPTAERAPNLGVARLTVVEEPTLDRPEAAFEVEVANRGAETTTGALHLAVDGERRAPLRLDLAPGQTVVHAVRWRAPAGQPPAAPVTLEAYVEAPGDVLLDDDLDTLRLSLQDPALPLDPMYRQAGDVDIAIDAPWRLAADRDHLPLLVFVPSIGRPSRYATFHETLAMRRGVLPSNSSTRTHRVTSRVGRAAGNLGAYTSAMFIRELIETSDEDAALRRFIDRVATTDFAMDYGLYAAGAWGGAQAFELLHERARTLRGLRWTGTELGGTIARAQLVVAVGYLLPNLVRGRLDRRVAIDLAALGISTAAVEAIAHGVRAGATRTALSPRLTAFLEGHGKMAIAGGWLVDVGKLILVLYASEWLSNSIDRPLVRWEARRALRARHTQLLAAAGGTQEAFAAALDAYADAFDAYRNIVS